MQGKQVKFTKPVLERKPPATGRVEWRDTDSPLILGITSNNARALSVRFRIRGKAEQHRMNYPGGVDIKNLPAARAWAADVVAKAKQGVDPRPKPEPVPAAVETFGAVVKNYMKRYVRDPERLLLSADEIERIFDVYVLPRWKSRPFTEIDRGDIADLLDDLQDNHGAVQADRVLAVLSGVFNWFIARTKKKDYVSPIVRGMRRTRPKERARDRVLKDDELRLLWPIFGRTGTLGAIMKVALLTAQRRAKVLSMKWEDISADGVWTIPREEREKDNPGFLELSEAALAIIRAQPRVQGNPYVFATSGKGHFDNYDRAKKRIDRETLKVLRETDSEAQPLPHWQLHDLRRTARTLMTRARVEGDVGERVLGHAITGIRAIYEIHDPREQDTRRMMAEALEKLAALVGRIVSPADGNVVDLSEARA